MKLQFAIIFLLLATFSYSQKSKIIEGSFKSLKEVKEYNLIFDYTGLEVLGYNSEEDFLEDKMKKRDVDEPGSGKAFRESWFSDRGIRYEPRYIKSFNEYFKKGEIKVTKNTENTENIEYTMKIHTTYIYSGYNVGVASKESEVSVVISVFKTNEPSNLLLVFEINNVRGHYSGDKAVMRGFEFHTGERIGYAYWALGKYFAKKLRIGIK